MKKLKELASPSSTSLIEPDVKSNTRGRSSAKKKKLDRSTTRKSSAFEYALGTIESIPIKLSSAAVTKKEKISVRRTRSCTFLHLLP